MDIKVLVLEGKHHREFYNVTTPQLMVGACMNILKEHLSMGYYQDGDKKIAEDIISKKDGKRAYRFIFDRSDYQYENVSTEILQESKI